MSTARGTPVYDTLVMMGVGGEVTVALLPFLLPADLERSPALLRGLVTHPAGRWLLCVVGPE